MIFIRFDRGGGSPMPLGCAVVFIGLAVLTCGLIVFSIYGILKSMGAI